MTDKDNERAKKRAWRIANRDRTRADKIRHYWKYRDRERAKKAAKYAADREAQRALRRANYAANKARILEGFRQAYKADPERFRARNRAHRAANLEMHRERGKAYSKAWLAKDRARALAKIRRGNYKYRALKMGAFIEVVDPLTVFNRDEGICGICHKPIGKGKWHIDHIIPLSKGGAHAYANVQLAHARCNLTKQSKIPKGQLGLFQRVA